MIYRVDNLSAAITVDPALIVAYGRIGDVNALKTFDYTLFTREQIWKMYFDVVGHNFSNDYIRDGSDFLEKVLNTVYTCETKDYTIYLRPVSETQHIHKVFSKISKTFMAMYACDLTKIILDERLDVPYFRKFQPRSTYDPVTITPSVILDYCKNGEIELVKNINFSLIPANHIQNIYNELIDFRDSLDKLPDDPLYTNEMWNNLEACVKFMSDNEDAEDYFESDTYCIYSKPLNKEANLFKVFDRINDRFTLLTKEKIYDILKNLGENYISEFENYISQF
jgi:hypothetical protein